MIASEIKKLLSERYRQPEWAIAFEVADSTGIASGYADAIAMSMYPSRGLEIHGFEIKVSRRDLATEIKNPDKAEKFAAYCDKWWLVAPKDLASKAALEGPAAWGVIAAYESGLMRVIKPAQKTPARALERPFVAALFRRLSSADEKAIEEAVIKRVEAGTKRISDRLEEQAKRRAGDGARSCPAKIAAIEAALGFNVAGWEDHKRICAAIRVVLKLGPDDLNQFGYLLGALEDRAKAVCGVVAEFRDLFAGESKGGES